MIQTRTDIKGRRRFRVRVEHVGRESQRTFERLSDARAWEAEVKRRNSAGEIAVLSRHERQATVAMLWKASIEQDPVQPTTRVRYESLWRLHVEPRWGRIPAVQVRSAEVREWASGLVSSGLSTSSVAQAIAVLSRGMNRAISQGLRESNPARGARPRARSGELSGQAFTVEQVRLLVDAACPADRPMFLLASVAGLRFGELAGLQVGDVSVERGEVAVNRTITEVSGRQQVKDAPKSGQRRVVGVGSAVVGVLCGLLDDRTEDAWLWPNSHGGPQRYSTARRRLTEALKDAGLPRIGLHSLRRTSATLAQQAGTPLRDIQAQLGHATPSMTMRYARPSTLQQSRGADTVAAQILANE